MLVAEIFSATGFYKKIDMKKNILTFVFSFISIFTFAQHFGGGTGTEGDPYRIYTKEHLEEIADNIVFENYFLGKHFRLMNNIDDSVTRKISSFEGYFHGGNHYITVNIDEDSKCALLGNLYGYLDSLTLIGNLSFPSGFCYQNFGTIISCTNNTINKTSIDSTGYTGLSGICYINGGQIISCVNNSDIYGESDVSGICNISYRIGWYYDTVLIDNCINNGNIEVKYGMAAGIVWAASSFVTNCINYGNISQYFVTSEPVGSLGGICGEVIMENYYGVEKISNCQNYGNISTKAAQSCGGIASDLSSGAIEKCSNYGNVSGKNEVGGICGNFYLDCYSGSSIKDCFNTGQISGELHIGGICGGSDYNEETEAQLYISNCLNLGKSSSSAICDTMLILTNNFFDKQLLPNIFGVQTENIPNQAEGKLTTQLVGTSPELQAMLGDGWSYAEGRYPIPLGLENDSLALLAATPIYLHYDSETDYNHVDSVARNFTVGTENGVYWTSSSNMVSIEDENVTLNALGYTTLTANLGNYSKQIRINIVDLETTEIDENNVSTFVSIFPNPASDFITLNLNGQSANKIEIYDISGRMIFVSKINSDNTQINTSNFASGTYFVNVYNGEQKIAEEKIVKE